MARHVKREKAEISTPESRTSDRKKQSLPDATAKLKGVVLVIRLLAVPALCSW